MFTVICYYVAFPPKSVMRAVNPLVADSKGVSRFPAALRDAITVKRMAPVQVVAICFCGAAKTTSLGIPLVAAMWSQLDNFTISSIQVPVLLYTVEQVFLAQFFTIFFRHWLKKATKGVTDTESTAPEQPLCAASEAADLGVHDEGRKLEQIAGSDKKGHKKGHRKQIYTI